jgi:hypothetical protein
MHIYYNIILQSICEFELTPIHHTAATALYQHADNASYTTYVNILDTFLNNQPEALIIQICSVIKLYIFRASPLPIISSSLLYILHW